MRFLKRTLPHLVISLNLALMIVIYLDMRNPMMGFLEGMPFLVLSGASILAAVCTAVTLYGDSRKQRRKHKRTSGSEKPANGQENVKKQ